MKQLWTLTLQDTGKPSDPPVHIRVRHLLKIAGRGLALQCVNVSTDKIIEDQRIEVRPQPSSG